MRLISAGILLCALAWPAALRAQGTAVLAVRVVNPSDAPVAGARLELVGTRLSGVSDDAGWVRLQGVPAGQAVLRVTHSGYAPLETTVQLAAGAHFEADVELAPTGAAARAVGGGDGRHEPRLDSAGFYRRREAGLGVFLTGQDITRSGARQTSDLFLSRTISGVRVTITPGRGYRLQSLVYGRSPRRPDAPSSSPWAGRDASGGEGACFMSMIIDGVPVRLDDLNQVPVQRIAGVEVYRRPSDIPREFKQSGDGCGVVVMWTRTASPPPDTSPLRPVATNSAP